MHVCRSCRRATLVGFVFCTVLCSAGCLTLPPSASLNPPIPPAHSLGCNAWLRRVEISDPEIDQKKREQLEISLSNNLLRFLREGRYFLKVEMLPGQPQAADCVLRFRFDRYGQERRLKGLIYFDASDLSATLSVSRPGGEIVKEVKARAYEEHPVDPFSPESALPSGMGARTDLIEDLLRQLSSASDPGS